MYVLWNSPLANEQEKHCIKFCDICTPNVPRHLKVEQRAGQPAVATVEAEEDLPEKKKKQEQTLFNDALKKRWFISHIHDFRMRCDPPSQNRVVQKIQGGSSPTMISERGVTPLPQQGDSATLPST